MKNLKKYIFLILIFLSGFNSSFSQGGNDIPAVDYVSSPEYEIGGIVVTGTNNYAHNAILLLAELSVGQKINIPGDDISKALKKLWSQKLFSEISINLTKTVGKTAFLEIVVKERPKLHAFRFLGVSKKEANKLREKMDMFKGQMVTDHLLANTTTIIRNHFIDERYVKTKVEVDSKFDTSTNNGLVLTYTVKRGDRYKIDDIIFEGNTSVSDFKLNKAMKETKKKAWWRFWKTSKYYETNYEADKAGLIALFSDKGLRDAKIESDTVIDKGDGTLEIRIKISEGKKYYFGNINWVGNSKYRSSFLGDTILSIKKGELFSQSLLDSKLFMNPTGSDVTSLYMDNGYLFFNVDPVEIKIYNDTIDYEMRISEGKVARVRDVIIKGNTKTNDHVIRREIRTKPGDLFNRNDIIRTQRELSQLNLFDPEKFGVNPMPDPASGMVDIEYTVEEKPSDQVELSGGWGGGRVIGTIGLVFNNFSIQRLFKKGAWQPLPAGDGQQLSLRAQSNGFFYQGYNFSFVEPWMFGKKPNSFSVNGYYTVQSNGVKKSDPSRTDLQVTGMSVGFGKRLKWPDDFFTTYKEFSYQYYDLNDFGGIFSFSNGYANNISFRYNISRNSIDQPLYPRTGSNITFSLRFTPPYSLLGRKDVDFKNATDQEKYKWLEYHKWKFTTQHYISLSKDKKLVLKLSTGFGFLFSYNKDYGASPFERFYLGGSGLQGLNFIFAREIVALRGYDDNAVATSVGGLFVAKYTAELRYPLSLNPNATIYGLAFMEAGNTWNDLKQFNPFQVKRAFGTGVRIFLPMFGLLGLDYGWSIDQLDAGQAGQGQQNIELGTKGIRGQFHFTIGMNLGEL